MTELRKRMIGELRLRNRSENTIKAYVDYVYRLARHYRASPDALSLEQIRAFLIHLTVDRGQAPATLNVAFNALVFFYRDVLGWNLEGKLKGLQRPRIRESLPKAYGQDETYRILHDGCLGPDRRQLFLMTLYSTGMRLSEACALRWGHVELDRDMIRIDCGKGGKDRYVPLAPLLRERFLAGTIGRKPGDAVFASSRGDGAKPIGPATGRRYYNLAVERCGVDRKGGPHCLRHSYAVHQLERGVDINTLRVLLGHKSLQTTMIYLRVAKRRVEQVGTPLDELFVRAAEERRQP
jgi:site-specific recombinase XerD